MKYLFLEIMWLFEAPFLSSFIISFDFIFVKLIALHFLINVVLTDYRLIYFIIYVW